MVKRLLGTSGGTDTIDFLIFMLIIVGLSINCRNPAMDNKLNEKSYNKSKTVRMLIRNEMFERNRQQSSTYLAAYDEATQAAIK